MSSNQNSKLPEITKEEDKKVIENATSNSLDNSRLPYINDLKLGKPEGDVFKPIGFGIKRKLPLSNDSDSEDSLDGEINPNKIKKGGKKSKKQIKKRKTHKKK